ncbi:DNA repair protein RecN [Facklamia miroungae]|uniref:DNA repair protein RecN n=1 Tax=Facklamia miroungae TaxID=120956 RepID=A0A1G7U423_9LACT|nr:DNA repair protein RecN [Facklamia miroungae]NKZ29893.1 DNA repair protein RecN [Facklamia miroungae]SDG42011.1 DNA repair protein RecN (Recombination protein N) [Facklamia miroungae]
MLISLRIENFAIIDQVSIDFSERMTVLSGETGAGKSIIIDAIGILCGGRGSTDFIRKGSQNLFIEGLFSLQKNEKLLLQLEEIGIKIEDPEDALLIQREIHKSGRNVIKVNQRPVNVTMLKQIGRYLVDIHGQNEHQALLDSSRHLELLDLYATESLEVIKEEYQVSFALYRDLRQTLLSKKFDEQEALQRLNFLEFQFEELNSLDLVADEDQELLQQSKKMQNAQVMNQHLSEINQLMTDQEGSVDQQIERVLYLLQTLGRLEDQYLSFAERLSGFQIDLKELSREIAFSLDIPDYDDQVIDAIQKRLSQLEKVQKKYGRTIEDLISYQLELAKEIDQIKNFENYQKQTQDAFLKAYQETYYLAHKISVLRQEAAKKITSEVEDQLKELYMPYTEFQVKISQVEEDSSMRSFFPETLLRLNETGLDQVEFYAVTNLGEESQPLARIASGGELSRFMLALKTIFARNQAVETLIFDEIDTGVSGRVASAIASKMAKIGQTKQVLCITHLAQVAAAANQQLIISKEINQERTITQVDYLTEEERVAMIASMMSGEVQSDSSLQVAQDLLTSYQNN